MLDFVVRGGKARRHLPVVERLAIVGGQHNVRHRLPLLLEWLHFIVWLLQLEFPWPQEILVCGSVVFVPGALRSGGWREQSFAVVIQHPELSGHPVSRRNRIWNIHRRFDRNIGYFSGHVRFSQTAEIKISLQFLRIFHCLQFLPPSHCTFNPLLCLLVFPIGINRLCCI